MSDEALGKIVQDDKVELYVLYCEGAPAGTPNSFRRPKPNSPTSA
jgi:hypothetical protein